MEGKEVELTFQGRPLKKVESFRYLGRLLTTSESEWTMVQANLQKSRNIWARIVRVWIRKGTTLHPSVTFYKVVVQSVFIYTEETRVATGRTLEVLEHMHRKVACRVAGRREAFYREMGTCSRPLTEEVMVVLVLLSLREYLKKHQDWEVHCVSTRTILGLCLESVRPEIVREIHIWWEQRGGDSGQKWGRSKWRGGVLVQ